MVDVLIWFILIPRYQLYILVLSKHLHVFVVEKLSLRGFTSWVLHNYDT